jgi:hypothetical protein
VPTSNSGWGGSNNPNHRPTLALCPVKKASSLVADGIPTTGNLIGGWDRPAENHPTLGASNQPDE